MSRSNLVLGYLVAYLRSSALPTWKSPKAGKAPAPAGTMANPLGTVSVDKNRSLWCPRVRMTGIKPSFTVPALASRRLKLGSVDDVAVITDITVFKSKGIADIIAVLLLLCSVVEGMPRIIAETLEASFEARPARHSSLVLSGLDVHPQACNADSFQRANQGGGEGHAAAAAEVATAPDAAPPGNEESEIFRAGPLGDGAIAAQGAADGDDAGAGPVPAGPNHPIGDSGAVPQADRAGTGGDAKGAGGALARVGGGAPGGGDGIQESSNVSVEAAYIMRALRAAADKRASRLAVRRAVRWQKNHRARHGKHCYDRHPPTCLRSQAPHFSRRSKCPRSQEVQSRRKHSLGSTR